MALLEDGAWCGKVSRHGGRQADIEAFTETQWVTLRGDLPTYPC